VSIIRVTDKVLPKYVQAILVSDTYKQQLLELSKGATSREAITKKQLEDFKIPLPHFSEQQDIANTVEKIEIKINDLEQNLNNITKLKQSILIKYLF
jgi:restriction endonuclease S subunit